MGKAVIASKIGGIIEIIDDGVVAANSAGLRSHYSADRVVLALGTTPVNALASALRGKVKQLYIVGDAKEPRGIREAIADGFVAAFHL